MWMRCSSGVLAPSFGAQSVMLARRGHFYLGPTHLWLGRTGP